MKKFATFIFVFTFLFIGCESEIDKSFIGVSYSQDLAIEDGFNGRLLIMFSKKFDLKTPLF